MSLRVRGSADGHRLAGDDNADVAVASRFLGHLSARLFSPATVRAYAFELPNFLRFCAVHDLALARVTAADMFAYLDWLASVPSRGGQGVVRLTERRRPAAATMNRRVAAMRRLFEFMVMTGDLTASPVPAARRSSGLRAPARGLLGHLGPGRRPRAKRGRSHPA